MDDPITLSHLVWGAALWYVVPFVLVLGFVLLLVIFGRAERWKSRQPDWDNDWDNENDDPRPVWESPEPSRAREIEVVEFIDYDGSFTGRPGGKVRMPGRMVEDDSE